jgi:sortase A
MEKALSKQEKRCYNNNMEVVMNQILVTEKIYITPELKRKKRMYKIKFCMSIFAICLLFSYYIYAEYDKGKSEEVSKDILAQLEQDQSKNKNDSTTKNIVNDVLIVSLDAERSEEASTDINENIQTSNYTANDGKEYSSEAVLEIPSLNITYPVLSETSEELLKISVNKYWGPNPNEIGNYCVVGHNYKNGKMFGKLSQMENGDVAILTANNKSVSYEVYDKYVVEPDDVSCTSQLTKGKRELTLITCTNYGTQRLVVKCREI